jgi:hypothetical protein
MLPPGLIPPHDPNVTVVALERRVASPTAPTSAPPSGRAIAFVVLVAFTVLALAVTAVDLLNG